MRRGVCVGHSEIYVSWKLAVYIERGELRRPQDTTPPAIPYHTLYSVYTGDRLFLEQMAW